MLGLHCRTVGGSLMGHLGHVVGLRAQMHTWVKVTGRVIQIYWFGCENHVFFL